MRRDGDKIILERESCPTAPKFWLWKILGGVKLEVRQLPSVVGAGKKWKVPLALAVVCGMAGLLGWWAEGWIGKLFFLVAYLAGGWKTGEEVAHRFKTGVLDIHFLMLAVAAGKVTEATTQLVLAVKVAVLGLAELVPKILVEHPPI